MEMGGDAMPEEFLKGKNAENNFRITATQIIATKRGKDDPADYKIDTSKTPHEIDLTSKEDGKDEKMYGIFKLEGDKLTLCLKETDKAGDRPKDFKTTKEGREMIMILKRK
jgi:uncharacterized protein (TIGR03067 family)